MLRKTKEQNTINFLSGVDEMTRLADEADKKVVAHKNTEKQHLDALAEEQKSKKLSNKDDGLKSARSIMSTGYEGRKEETSSSKYVKCETSNTIWGPGGFKEALKVKEDTRDNIDKTLQLEDEMATKRKADVERSTNVPAAGTTAVQGSKDRQNYSFKPPSHGIGIFDKEVFDRVPEKTAGETSAEESKARKTQQDDSWKGNGKMFSSKDVLNKLFDSFIEQGKNKNVQS